MEGPNDVNQSSSDDPVRVVLLSSAKPAVAFGIAGVVVALGPSGLALHAGLSGEVPLAAVVAACCWTAIAFGVLLHGVAQLRTTVRLSEHGLSVRRPLGSLEIRPTDVARIDVWTFERLGPMRPRWFGDAVARVRCKDGRTALFVVDRVAFPSWAPERFRQLFRR
jgi:hypothetical protein